MTEQLKRFIELADIIGLRLECKKCGCSVSLGDSPKDAIYQQLYKASSTLARCPGCGEEWKTSDSYLQQLFSDLHNLRDQESRLAYKLRLEIPGSEKP